MQRFLEVDDSVPLQAVQTEPLKAVRSVRLHRLRNAVGRADADPAAVGALTRTLTGLTPKRVRRGVLGGAVRRLAYAAPQPPDQGLMLELRRRFKPEVVALSDYLDRDLVALWGYDALD